MKTRKTHFSLVMIPLMVLCSFGQAQETRDRYLVKSGENVLRVYVVNRTQAPLTSLTLKFPAGQPPWFAAQKEAFFELGTREPAIVELPFQINSLGFLTEAVTVQLLAQEKVLGTITVNMSPEGTLGKVVGTSSTATQSKEAAVSKAEESVSLPTEYALRQNYPNPFNPSTEIQFDLPKASFVALEIYDPLGRVVRTLVRGDKATGAYTISWDGKNDGGEILPSGLYIYRLTTQGFAQTRKMLLVR